MYHKSGKEEWHANSTAGGITARGMFRGLYNEQTINRVAKRANSGNPNVLDFGRFRLLLNRVHCSRNAQSERVIKGLLLHEGRPGGKGECCGAPPFT